MMIAIVSKELHLAIINGFNPLQRNYSSKKYYYCKLAISF